MSNDHDYKGSIVPGTPEHIEEPLTFILVSFNAKGPVKYRIGQAPAFELGTD